MLSSTRVKIHRVEFTNETALEPFSWWLILGYAYSLGVGHLCVWRFVRTAHNSSGTELEPGQPRAALALGYLERALYTSLWLMGSSELILGWLALKAAGVLRQTAKDQIVYNTFLVGTGLSLGFGVVGGMLVQLADSGEKAQALVIAAGPIALSLGLIAVMRRP